MANITYIEAIRNTLREEMKRNENIFLMGEDIGVYGGAFGVTKNLVNEFGKERVRDTPMSEMAIVGAAIGAALMGTKPIVELMFMDFVALAIDQLQNNATAFRYVSNGQFKAPLILRTPAGAGRGYGATHSKSLESLLTAIPELIVLAPSTPYDAKGLLRSAIKEENNPIVFVEHKLLYGEKGEVPDEDYFVSIGKAAVRSEGADITLISHLKMSLLCTEVAQELKKQNISAEVIDLRTLAPVDYATIFNSVRKTGRVLTVEEGFLTGGIGAEIISNISEKITDKDLVVGRLGGSNTPIPCCPKLEKLHIPDKDAIIRKVNECMR